MKKWIALLLCVVTLFSLSACGEKEPAPAEPYAAPEDIEVAAAYINDTARVVARKLGQKEMKSVELMCVYYDQDGNKLLHNQLQCDFSQATELSIWSFAAAPGSVYMDVAVAKVNYADGTSYTCPGVSTWLEEASQKFGEAEFKLRMDELKNTEAAVAEDIKQMTVRFNEIKNGKVDVQLANNSGKEIEQVVLYLLWFDENGQPVDRGGVFVPNAGTVSAANLKEGKTSTYSVTAPEGATNVKGIVQRINYAEGSAWENLYIYEWALVNYSAFE